MGRWLIYVLLIVAGPFLAAAELCPVSFQLGSLDNSQISILQGKGYDLRPVARLSSDLFSLRMATGQNLWGFVGVRNGWDLYFEMPTGTGEFPILRHHYASVESVPDCESMRKQLRYLNALRENIVPMLTYQKNSSGLLDAFLAAEKADALSKNIPYNAEKVRTYFDKLKTGARRIWHARGSLPLNRRLHEVRQFLLEQGLRNYCKGRPRLHDLAQLRCTNCVGQTLVWLGILDEIGVRGAGFVLYTDHLQPVLVDSNSSTVIDLVYNRKLEQPVIVQDPHLLIASVLTRWPALIFPWDKAETRWERSFRAVSQLRDDSTVAPTKDSTYDFRLFAAQGIFSAETPPEEADLSWLMDYEDPFVDRPPRRYNFEPGEASVRFRECGILPPSEAELDHAWDTVHPLDQASITAKRKGSCAPLTQFYRPKSKDNSHQMVARLVYDPNIKLSSPELGFQVAQSASGADMFNTIMFKNKRDFERVMDTRNWDRNQDLKADLVNYLEGPFARKFVRFNALFKSANPFEAMIREWTFVQEFTRDLEHVNLIAQVFRYYADHPTLRQMRSKSAEVLAESFERMGANYRTYAAYLNSLNDAESARLLKWFEVFPFTSFGSKAEDEDTSSSQFDFRYPLEKFFIALLRETKAPNAQPVEVNLQNKKTGPLREASSSPSISVDLPKLDLPCGQHGALFVLCPDTAPPIYKPVKAPDLKPALLARLASLNPAVFFNPGDLLVLSRLWTKEVEQQFDLILKSAPFLEDRMGPTAAKFALLNHVKIIRGSEVTREGPMGLFNCEELFDSPCSTNLSSKTRSNFKLAARPAWLGENPSYQELLSHIARTASTCKATVNDGPWVNSPAHMSKSSVDVKVYSIDKEDVPYQIWRIKTFVGRHEIQYALVTKDQDCADGYGIERPVDESVKTPARAKINGKK